MADDNYAPVTTVAAVERHLARVRLCEACPGMFRPAIVGRPTPSRILLVGQAPGDREPKLGRPFAWTAGKTLFKWFESALGWAEDEVRNRVYISAVCRCFPGKRPNGGDRVPAPDEIERCADWLAEEFALLRPALVLPVGKLAIQQFLPAAALAEVVGQVHRVATRFGQTDVLPLPHPSGASTWHRTEPGKTLLARALSGLAEHPAVAAAERWAKSQSA